MGCFGWNPHCPQRRNNPNSLVGVDSHGAFRGIEKLVLRMGVSLENMSVLEIPGDAGNFRQTAASLVEEEEMARSRHCLSQ
jgi:hypothetical protein